MIDCVVVVMWKSLLTLVKRVCLEANESTFIYTFGLQLQMPHIISHRAVIVDLMTAGGEMRLRECERARMRAKVMTWNACAAVRVESGLWNRLFGTKRM